MKGLSGADRRLDKLEAPIKPGSRTGVVLLPRILPLDEWERLAVKQQDELARLTHEGLDRDAVVREVVGPDRPWWDKPKG